MKNEKIAIIDKHGVQHKTKFSYFASFPAIIAYEKAKVYEHIRNEIKGVYFASGQSGQVDKKMLDATTELFYKDLQTDFKKLTFNEMKEAFRMGSRGNFGEFYGINLKTLHAWINMYLSLEERKKAIMEHQQLKLTEANTLTTPEQVEADVLNMIKTEFKTTGTCTNYGNASYSYLVKLNQIEVNDYLNNLDEAVGYAAQELEEEAYRAKIMRDKRKHTTLQAELDRIDDGENTNRVNKIAHRLSVIKWAAKQ